MNVLVTGSSRGLGRAIILEFAKNHYDVIINYNKNKDKALSLVEELQKYSVNVKVIKADISNEEEVKKMFEEISSLDVLINNAAIALDKDPLEKTGADFNTVIHTNLTGTFLVTKYAIKKMKEGSILNISSTNALDTYYPESIDYDASKAGIISLTHNFSKYLTSIRVNCICPDWIDTDMNKEMADDYRQKIDFIKKEDLAKLIFKIAINKNINNQIIKVGAEDVRN
jgi:3-oxoacyl-[acyl-carrier protein] reductase